MILKNKKRKFIDVLLKINIGIQLEEDIFKDVLGSLLGNSRGVNNVVVKIVKLSFFFVLGGIRTSLCRIK